MIAPVVRSASVDWESLLMKTLGFQPQFMIAFILRVLASVVVALVPLRSIGQTQAVSFEVYLRKNAVDKKTLEVFLDPQQLSWAKFDPVTGYRLGNYLPRDGIQKSSTISTSQSNGARTSHSYSEKPCRINTYGDSF